MINVIALTSIITVPLLILVFLLILLSNKQNKDDKTVYWSLGFVCLLSIGLILIIFLVAPSEISTASPITSINNPSTLASSTPFTYYTYNPSNKTLNKINLSRTIGSSQLADYFHKNDESLFVTMDGNIVSIIGNTTRKFNTLPNVKKIRISNNQYVALANGKIYTSNNLRNWILDATKPNNVLDIDVPAQQTNLLHITTPMENIFIDAQQNKVLSRSGPEKKKFGSNVNKFVRFADSGVYLHDQYFQKGYPFADIDHYNRVYLVPDNISGYKVNNLHTSDQLAIIELNTSNGPEQINVSDQIQFHP